MCFPQDLIRAVLSAAPSQQPKACPAPHPGPLGEGCQRVEDGSRWRAALMGLLSPVILHHAFLCGMMRNQGIIFFFNDGSAKLGHRVEALFQGPSRCTMSSRDIDFPSGALQRCCSLWSGGNSSSATQFIQFGGAFRDFWRVNSGSSFGKQCGL